MRSLHRWLARDSDLAGIEHELAADKAEPGSMGGSAWEVINVVLSNTIALSTLLLTVANWRASRSERVEVRIEYAGAVVTVAANSPEDVQRMVDALTADRNL